MGIVLYKRNEGMAASGMTSIRRAARIGEKASERKNKAWRHQRNGEEKQRRSVTCMKGETAAAA